MEPLNDPELRALLREWKAPEAPDSLEARVAELTAEAVVRGSKVSPRRPWWDFLLRGYIRVPVPVACCLTILVIAAVWRMNRVASDGQCQGRSPIAFIAPLPAQSSAVAQASRPFTAPQPGSAASTCASDSSC